MKSDDPRDFDADLALKRFRLNGNDAGASLANEAIIRKLTEENEKLRSQVVQFLES